MKADYFIGSSIKTSAFIRLCPCSFSRFDTANYQAVLMRLQPVLALAAVGDEGHAQWNNLLHLFQDDLFHQFCLFLIDIEVQLVVYLQDHLAFQLLRLKTLVDADHCQLDDIGRAALDRGVDGVAFGITADNGVARVDIRQVTFPLEDGLDIAVLASGLDALVHVFLDSRIGLEITLDQLLRFGSGNTESFGQAEDGDTIDEPETPYRSGYRFTYWYLDKEKRERFNFNTSITESITLYAGWSYVNPDVPAEVEEPEIGTWIPEEGNPEDVEL